ncbi:MAG: N-acetylmuramoyl-L-alanine amidase [Alistipes sp.]|jgi:N-acetylmuramoyl-L-alanine amidase|nr:N-acetylmuramoyl-L-alanine amidase [Alistipes sp.]
MSARNNVHRKVLHIVLTTVFAFSICGIAAGQHKNFILVIDPGHGGQDPGAVSGRMLEKELNLRVALDLGARIAREMPDVEVLYTRTDDRAVGLAARGDFANRAGADLFLSIHTNSFAGSTNGTETYVMGMDKNEANLNVAKLENEVIKYEEDYTETYAGFDPNSTELSIIFGMLQFANFESSLSFARMIQKHYTTGTPMRDRGARQGPFAVLWKPTMPRVLTEMGFISNDSDRRYMFSEAGRGAIVTALFEAFREYRESVRQTDPVPAPPHSAQQTAPQAPGPGAQKPATGQPTGEFLIQLAATRSRVPTDDATWAQWSGRVVEIASGGWYKYSLPYSTRREAERALERVRRGGFPGAFIVEQTQKK